MTDEKRWVAISLSIKLNESSGDASLAFFLNHNNIEQMDVLARRLSLKQANYNLLLYTHRKVGEMAPTALFTIGAM